MIRKLAPYSAIIACFSVLIFANMVMHIADTYQFVWRSAAVVTAIFLPVTLLLINSHRIKHDGPIRL